MRELRQIGFIGKNVQGNRVYDGNGIGTTIAAQTGGLGGSGVGLYLIDETEEYEMSNVKSTQPTVTKHFTYASAFAGIGGMTLGLEPLGGIGVIAWEFDPTEKKRQFAQDAHKLLHPHVPIHGDICEANTDEIPDFDVFAFTPPCQAFSVAGKRGGFEDTRGTLTFEALRIARDKQPKILFMENVKGLVNHDKGRTMGTILHAINDIGYTVDFTVLNSKYFDVAQNRERVYLIAVRDDLITPEPWTDIIGTTIVPKAKKRYLKEGVRTFNFEWPEEEEVRTRLRDFLESEVDSKYYLSEEKTATLVAQLEEMDSIQGLPIREATDKGYDIAEEGDSVNTQFPTSTTRRGRVGKQIASTIDASTAVQGVVESEPILIDVSNARRDGGTRGLRTYSEIAPTLDARDYKEPRMIGRVELNGHDILKRVYSPDGQAPTLSAMGEGNTEPKIAEEVRPVITPDHVEKRQNGRRFKEDGEEAFTLTSIDRHGVAIGEYPRYRIRKLTPKECLRLQAIPEDIIDKLSAEFSDSRLYKFAGNGLTINVIKAIGEKLIKYL